MKASNEIMAVEDGLEKRLREYALNPFVKVEIVVEAEGKPLDSHMGDNGAVSE